MSKEIRTITDYFESTINALPPANNFVLVLDPENFLDLGEQYIDSTNDKAWEVLHYHGNDLTIRRKYASRKGNKAIILWVTPSLTADRELINLSYIYDIVEKAEKTIDLSLRNVLDELIPGTKWPEELFNHSKEIGQELSRFHSLQNELRKELPHKAPLNANHVRALLIALRNPQISLSDLILTSTPTQEALTKYVRLIMNHELNHDDKIILEETVESNIIGDFSEISSWFEPERDELAVFFYLLDMAIRYNVSNPTIQLKGAGLLSFDPETLGQSNITKTIRSIETTNDTKLRIAKIAETNLSPQQVLKVINCANLRDQKDLAEAIQNERQPLIVYTLSMNYLKEIMKGKELKASDLEWAQDLHSYLIPAEQTETTFSEKAGGVLNLLANMAQALHSLEVPFEPKNEMTALVDWWENSGFYKLQLAIADISSCLQYIYDDEVRKALDRYIENLRQQINAKLEKADLNLASIIEKNWKTYIAHPRLATNILREFILQKSITPSKDRKIWILIFDGMRLDTWKSIVRPLMMSMFENKEEKSYVSMLPSETDIARVAVLAGSPPGAWEDYDGGYTTNHDVLASRLFGLSRFESREKLKVTVASETDFGQRKLDERTFLYNVLIYNLSDDWIHDFRGDIRELNNTIEGTLKRKIMPDLDRRINENDYVVLTSDHGFIELARENEIRVSDSSGTMSFDAKRVIAYRCLRNIEFPKGYRVSLPQDFYTVAEGRKWFSRPRGKFARYAHGGISLDEMVVPGVLMRKIAVPKVELIPTYPELIEPTEDLPSQFDINIKNEGNRETQFQIALRANTGEEEVRVGSIQPNEFQTVPFTLKKPTLAMRHLEITLTWKTQDEETAKPHKKIIPVRVKERKDKVEFKFGGLDKIME